MELHQPPSTNDFETPPTHTTPQISMHVCETMHYRSSIDYI